MRLLRFFLALRHAGIPVSTGELISLLDGLQRGVGLPTVADLRELARCILIKDEDHPALFERVFAQYFDAAGDAGDADTWTPELAAVLAGLERSPPHQRPEAVVTSLLASIQSVGGGKRRSTPMRYRNYDDDLPLDSRGMRLAIGSSAPPENVELILSAGRLHGAFDAVVDGSHVSRGKPAPDVFLLAAERLRIAPSSCIVIEDAPAGIQAAVAAGTTAVGVTTTHTAAQLNDAGAHHLFSSPAAIPSLFWSRFDGP